MGLVLRAVTIAIASMTALGGCTGALPTSCDGGPCPTTRTVTNVYQSSVNRKLDVLFVLDDTAAIVPFADRVSKALPGLVDVLQQSYDPDPSLHIAVVPTSPCSTPPPRFLSAEMCGRVTNFSGTLETELANLASLGSGGCTPAQPLAAIERVLATPPPGWEGFLRPNAVLLIVVIAATDDASGPAGAPSPVSRTADLILGLKADPAGQVLIAVIGPGPCSSTAEVEIPAPRLQALAQSFGGNGLVYSICEDDYRPAFTIVRPLSALIGPPCIAGARDVDPVTPGTQLDCTVTDTVGYEHGTTTTTVVPSCDAAGPPCWKVVPPHAFQNCTGVELAIDHPASFCPTSTTTRFTCVAE